MERAGSIQTAALARISPLLRIFACSLLVVLCAQIAFRIPWNPVPVTLQTLGIMLTGVLLSPIAAASALVLYLAYGAVGLPVFAPTGPGGLAAFFGPTGGYLMSFPLAAALTSIVYQRLRRYGQIAGAAAGGLAGLLTIYLFGAQWLALLTGQTLVAVLPIAVFPFIAADLAKLAVVVAVSQLWLSPNKQ